jgi:hypothetical protein
VGIINAAMRKKMPASEFALPGKRFPLSDKEHARKALQLAPRSVKAGNISKAQEAEIDAKARRKLGK